MTKLVSKPWIYKTNTLVFMDACRPSGRGFVCSPLSRRVLYTSFFKCVIDDFIAKKTGARSTPCLCIATGGVLIPTLSQDINLHLQ